MIEVNKDNFAGEVLASSKPVLVDVWGPTCQPCLALMPQVEELANKYQDQVKVVKLNSAENRRLCIDLRVIGLPAFLLFKEGKEVERLSGKDIDIEDIEKCLQANL
ncbi:thioredoxin [Collibacillus ludicampi]|uniref:Thioredoxin n=1 Tax=Collibacillus ludicampi TaxID=2771369 RepID=A0AAV4LFJ0_9BACL|nr:thioredoxin family protein [Collibacillus ludicampi]GIM46567.1 thioredoxin [Collibacillus ludicampi]